MGPMRTFMAATLLGMLLAAACDDEGTDAGTQACIDNIVCFADCLRDVPPSDDPNDQPRSDCYVECNAANEYARPNPPPNVFDDQAGLDAYTYSLALCLE